MCAWQGHAVTSMVLQQMAQLKSHSLKPHRRNPRAENFGPVILPGNLRKKEI
jgi:hypothetical protein